MVLVRVADIIITHSSLYWQQSYAVVHSRIIFLHVMMMMMMMEYRLRCCTADVTYSPSARTYMIIIVELAGEYIDAAYV